LESAQTVPNKPKIGKNPQKTRKLPEKTAKFPLTKRLRRLKVDFGAVLRTRMNTGVSARPQPPEKVPGASRPGRQKVHVAGDGPIEVHAQFKLMYEGVTTWQRD
jgi:hypothetical protein